MLLMITLRMAFSLICYFSPCEAYLFFDRIIVLYKLVRTFDKVTDFIVAAHIVCGTGSM